MKRFAYLSLIASILTIGIKFWAYFITSSISILSDAVETVINLISSIILIHAIIISQKPPDKEHLYGHGKVEYFSSLLEGIFILLAGIGILYGSFERILSPRIVVSIEYGIVLSIICGAINFIVAFILLKGAKQYDSIALEADAKHLLSDVISTIGIVVGLSIMYFYPKKLWFLDPIIGFILGINIIRMSIPLIRRSISELMDRSLPEKESQEIISIIESHTGKGKWHALKTRKAGTTRFIEFHLLFPGDFTVKRSHDICSKIEDALLKKFPNSNIIIHVEPEEDEIEL